MRISTFAALTNDVIRSLRTRNPYPTFIVLVGEQTKLQQVFLPTNNPPLMFSENTSLISYKLDLNMSTWIAPNRSLIQLGTYNTQNGFNTSRSVEKIPRYFRIGSVVSIPWTMPVRDPLTGYIMRDYQDREMYQGYCIDLINELAKTMNFQYELVIASRFGKKLANNSWTGLVGMLMRGRKPISEFEKTYQIGSCKDTLWRAWWNLVWATADAVRSDIPSNATNIRKLRRIFTLKESIWFALTSFTPQGGGEAPKALSGRTLVAAYWLFVVLMLATFTANLAAFLTVERMQSPVQSLEQLARQSRINYTVVDNSNAHEYFKNMKHAEDIIYRVWKEITLNASNDQKKFRVWDYPVKEQYGQILEAIEKTGPVSDAKTGFDKVLESEQGEFALIHDSAEIKYEVSKNCNLTEVGELFAEQPYSQ
ncbi:ionotropic receptor 25a [Diaphorina citri]|uniref:Ionotropic receptor 25a n=1 Tax=Diaphorina citri TaxID=121845 RepID=A0A3Q0IX34_DIACI|nr:ionotropic receptor 25a [Diaphorina citri]